MHQTIIVYLLVLAAIIAVVRHLWREMTTKSEPECKACAPNRRHQNGAAD